METTRDHTNSFPRIRQRYEAWWEGEPLDSPIVRVTAPQSPLEPDTPPGDPAELYEWLIDPERVLPRLERRLEATCYAGDAFPWFDPVSLSLAAVQAAYLGAPYHVDPHTLTGWTEPLFESWSSRPPLVVDPHNPWWKSTRRLLEAGARRGAGRYAVSIPDLQGGGEILALLRGTERLALDLFDCPQVIAPALEEINTSWLSYYRDCYEIIHRWQEGYVDWLGIWSESPAVTVECDFSVMISTDMFIRYFLPAIAQQTDWIGRTIFHLDGPGAIPHLASLLDLTRLKGIQWVPPPGRPRPTDWIPLLRRILDGGKRVVVDCAPDEVLPLLEALDWQSLMLTTACNTPPEAGALMEEVRGRFGVKG